MKFDRTVVRIALMRSAFFARVVLFAVCFVDYVIEVLSESRHTAPMIIAVMLIFMPAVIRYYIGEGTKRRRDRAGRRATASYANKPVPDPTAPYANKPVPDPAAPFANKPVPDPSGGLPESLIKKYKFSPAASWGDNISVVTALAFLIFWQVTRCRNVGFAIQCLLYYKGVQEWLLILPLITVIAGVVTYVAAYAVIYPRVKKEITAGVKRIC